MSRRIASRLKIRGEFIAHGPLHVGGLGGNTDVDLALAVDGKNRFYVPGTSLIGPMRAWLYNRMNDSDRAKLDDLFGPPQKKGKDDTGHASFVIIEDGLVKRAGREIEAETIETRDGVGINRVTGAAADKIKYDRAILPDGSRIALGMTVEIATDDDAQWIKGVIGSLLDALAEGKIRFGAAKTRGLGGVGLKLESAVEQRLLSPTDIINTLRNRTDGDIRAKLGKANLEPWPQLEIRIGWHPKGALMVKAEREGMAVDMLPLTSALVDEKGDRLALVLPGSSIKGALRSHAERIVRTVRNFSAPSEDDPKRLFLAQLEMKRAGADGKAAIEDAEAAKLIGSLFGQAAKRDGKSKAGQGALVVEDCCTKPEFRFTREQWTTIETAKMEIEQGKTKSEFQEALEAAHLSKTQPAMHVAIDRWTGGAADGFLYSVLEPHGITWDEIVLTLDLERLGKGAEQYRAVALLLLVLRDLTAGRIPLGFGVNRGMGAIEVDGVTITAYEAQDEVLKDWSTVTIKGGKIEGVKDKPSLNNTWKNWANGEKQ